MQPKPILYNVETVFAGNDYLGLARDPRLLEAMYEGGKRYGISTTSSRWAIGWTEIHEKLEQELTKFFKTDDTCLLGGTYVGGSVYFEVMRKFHDTVYCDEFVHSNQYLGMKAAGFEIRTFTHLDTADLSVKLAQHTGKSPLVATDGIYGISGEIAPLKELWALTQKHGGRLFIDDAHGVFSLGPTGRGTAEEHGITGSGITILGSMSKALGCNGGFLAGDQADVDAFRRASAVCGGSHPAPPIAAACVRALEIVRQEPERLQRMKENAVRMRAQAAEHGIGVVSSTGPIIALILKDEFEAQALSKHFLAFGLGVPYFKYPSEPRQNFLRCVSRTCYTEENLRTFSKALQARPKSRS